MEPWKPQKYSKMEPTEAFFSRPKWHGFWTRKIRFSKAKYCGLTGVVDDHYPQRSKSNKVLQVGIEQAFELPPCPKHCKLNVARSTARQSHTGSQRVENSRQTLSTQKHKEQAQYHTGH